MTDAEWKMFHNELKRLWFIDYHLVKELSSDEWVEFRTDPAGFLRRSSERQELIIRKGMEADKRDQTMWRRMGAARNQEEK